MIEQNSPRVGFIEALRLPGAGPLATSRAASKLAIATLSYGAMVYLAAQGADQWQISLVSASTYLSAVLFGLQGGMLADSLSKRMAITGAYVAMAVACILLPAFFGTGVGNLMVLMFVSSALMQVVSPSLKSAVALVARPRDLATVSATVSMVGSVASAIGSSFLAPVLIKMFGIELLLAVVAIIMVLGAVSTWRMPSTEAGTSLRTAIGAIDWRTNAFSMRRMADWYIEHRSVGAMILAGAIVVSLFEAFSTLVPVYVRDVLDSDPTNAVYIFAPAGIGFVLGMFMTPVLIDRIGSRRLAILSVTIMSIATMMFGLVDFVAPVLAPISPLRLLGSLLGVSINDKVLAASVIAVPANFGSTAAGASVQTYINARAPLTDQGATFGLQEVQENVLTLVLVVGLGVISSFTGPRVVFIVAPLCAFALVLTLIRYSARRGDSHDSHRGDAWRELMGSEEPSGPGRPSG